MTLGQFALAVNESPRWVLNAFTRLGLPRRYGEPLARRLSLARFLSAHLGMRLPDAFVLAGRVLKTADPHQPWTHESEDGTVSMVINLPRFFTTYGAHLSLALSKYGEKPRGRRPRRRRSAIERAREYGVDVTLLDSALSRTPEQRLMMASENMEFLAELRKAMR